MRLLKSTAVVSLLTFCSRLVGFVRESVIATTFGASAATDAFFVAFRIPNFLRQLFAEGSFSSAFVPVLHEAKAKGDLVALRELIDRISGTLLGVLTVVTAIGILLASVLVGIFAPGFLDEPEKFSLARDLLRITFPYLPLIALTALAGGILNAHSRFAVPALTPILLNVAMIFAALVLSPYFSQPIEALAWGVLLGGVLQLCFQIVPLMRLGLLPRPRFDWQHPSVQKVFRLMIPTLFAASIMQINLLVDSIIASLLQTGSVSWLYLSDRLLQLPQGVFGVALGTIMLQHLSSRFSSSDEAGFRRSLDWGLRLALFLAIPISLLLIVLAQPIIWIVYGYGRFSERDVLMASASLQTLACGLFAYFLVKVLNSAYFSRQDPGTPVRAGVYSMVSNMLLNAIIVGSLVWHDYPAPHIGLGLASALAALLNSFLLYRWLRKAGVYEFAPDMRTYVLKLVLGSAVLLFFAVTLLREHHEWAMWGGLQRLLHFLWIAGVAGVGYLVTLLLLGIRPRHFVDR